MMIVLGWYLVMYVMLNYRYCQSQSHCCLLQLVLSLAQLVRSRGLGVWIVLEGNVFVYVCVCVCTLCVFMCVYVCVGMCRYV